MTDTINPADGPLTDEEKERPNFFLSSVALSFSNKLVEESSAQLIVGLHISIYLQRMTWLVTKRGSTYKGSPCLMYTGENLRRDWFPFFSRSMIRRIEIRLKDWGIMEKHNMRPESRYIVDFDVLNTILEGNK